MHPQFVVWLQDDEGRVVAYELFFSGRKAKRSYKRATKTDEHGLHELIGETGSYTAMDEVNAKIRFFGEYISTSKDRWRRSFLNLDGDEERELSERYQLPIEVIRQVSRIERDVSEKKRYFMHSQDARTSAMVRKYAPRWMSRIVHRT